MKIPTTNQVKSIYWKKAKGNVFSSNLGSLDKDRSSIPLRVERTSGRGNILVARIYYDGSVYEALNYGFHEEFDGHICHIEEQLGNFLNALQQEWPHLYFEPYNASIIDVTVG